MKAYVLVQTRWKGDRLAERLRSVPEIVAAEDVSGAFDAIATVHSSAGELRERILARIRTLPGVTRALPVPLANVSVPLEPSVAFPPARSNRQSASPARP
jgi:DNA-binding Lrp family transcriptional regulator